MKLKLEIEMDNEAFTGGGFNGNEVSRILRKLSDRWTEIQLEEGFLVKLIDCNGNKVGEAEITPGP